MAKTKNYQIPFDLEGNMLGYEPYTYNGQVRHEMRDVFEFTTLLKYEGYHKGRSSVGMTLSDLEGKTYNMMISDFDDLLRSGKQEKEGWYATFTFIKKGTSYGIQLVNK